MGATKKNLRKRSTFEQALNIVKKDEPLIQDLPNRFSTQLFTKISEFNFR